VSDAVILFAAATAGGAVNAIAGGGSLITFPVLVWLGREPILANATNTVSLSPGSVAALYGFRHELDGLRRWIVLGTIPSILGGLAGSWLLLRTPGRVFESLVPWLIAFATALFGLAGPITRAAQRQPGDDTGVPARPRWAAVLAYQFLVSVYGGYFGAGIGIMMLAGLALVGFTAIHRMIALRNVYAIWINAVAALYFIAHGTVQWPDALVLTAGQITGSWLSARVARRLRPGVVRAVVIMVGIGMAASLFLRRH
jgi:uncharacterized membrane protein YfcA